MSLNTYLTTLLYNPIYHKLLLTFGLLIVYCASQLFRTGEVPIFTHTCRNPCYDWVSEGYLQQMAWLLGFSMLNYV